MLYLQMHAITPRYVTKCITVVRTALVHLLQYQEQGYIGRQNVDFDSIRYPFLNTQAYDDRSSIYSAAVVQHNSTLLQCCK